MTRVTLIIAAAASAGLFLSPGSISEAAPALEPQGPPTPKDPPYVIFTLMGPDAMGVQEDGPNSSTNLIERTIREGVEDLNAAVMPRSWNCSALPTGITTPCENPLILKASSVVLVLMSFSGP
ncbi:MAG: hypothetical protein KGL74_05485 [Elusimicrobia bacterium]|nr:hypothetical protein [Elusimicrobiota bacterium]MDE2510555.1 hypothetical protein [Elusimicrobiota bacterium]